MDSNRRECPAGIRWGRGVANGVQTGVSVVLRSKGDLIAQMPGSVAFGPRPKICDDVSVLVNTDFSQSTFPPVQAPLGATTAILSLDRSGLPPNSAASPQPYLLALLLEASIDGGLTWPSYVGITAGLPDTGMPDASIELILPNSPSVMIRPCIGAAIPLDVGIAYTFTNNVVAPPGPIHNSVTFDQSGGPGSYNGATSLSWSHAGAASPTSYYGVVGISWTSLVPLTPAVNWDTAGSNTAMTAVAGTQATSTSFQTTIDGLTQFFDLINPTAGTVTVGVTNGIHAVFGKGVCSTSWTSVSQTTPSRSGTTNSVTVTPGNSASITVTGTATTSAVLEVVAAEGSAGQLNGTNQTSVVANGSGAGGQQGGCARAAGNGNITFTDPIITVTTRVLQSAFEILQAGAGGATTPWAHRSSRILGTGPMVS